VVAVEDGRTTSGRSEANSKPTKKFAIPLASTAEMHAWRRNGPAIRVRRNCASDMEFRAAGPGRQTGLTVTPSIQRADLAIAIEIVCRRETSRVRIPAPPFASNECGGRFGRSCRTLRRERLRSFEPRPPLALHIRPATAFHLRSSPSLRNSASVLAETGWQVERSELFLCHCGRTTRCGRETSALRPNFISSRVILPHDSDRSARNRSGTRKEYPAPRSDAGCVSAPTRSHP